MYFFSTMTTEIEIAEEARIAKIAKRINIASGFFASLASILALATLILLGVNMDYANFPGSNLVIDSYPEDDASGRSGLVKLVDGFKLKLNEGVCTNFKPLTNTGTKICASVVEDNAVALEIIDKEGEVTTDASHGWIVGAPCTKTGTLTDCSPFGLGSPVSGMGQATFGILAINVVLFGAHTGVEAKSKKSLLFGLNLVWTIVAFSLYVWAAVAWSGFCDKIDTGLGRYVVVGSDSAVKTPACATSYCTISFGGFVASFAVALVFARIPDILMFFGCCGLGEAGADRGEYDQVDDDDLEQEL